MILTLHGGGAAQRAIGSNRIAKTSSKHEDIQKKGAAAVPISSRSLLYWVDSGPNGEAHHRDAEAIQNMYSTPLSRTWSFAGRNVVLSLRQPFTAGSHQAAPTSQIKRFWEMEQQLSQHPGSSGVHFTDPWPSGDKYRRYALCPWLPCVEQQASTWEH